MKSEELRVKSEVMVSPFGGRNKIAGMRFWCMEEQFLRAEPNIIAAKPLHNSTLNSSLFTLKTSHSSCGFYTKTDCSRKKFLVDY